jgi:hypothetical protein
MGDRVSKYVDDTSGKLLNQMKNAVDVTSLQREAKGTFLKISFDYIKTFYLHVL